MIILSKDIITNISRFINCEKNLCNVISGFPEFESEIWKQKCIDKFLNYNSDLLKKKLNMKFSFNKNRDYHSIFNSLTYYPSKFIFPDIHNYNVVKIEGNKIHFNGNFKNGNRCVISNYPCHLTEQIFCSFYYIQNKFLLLPNLVTYFEIRILDYLEEFENPCVTIGFCDKKFPLVGSQPGWDSYSYGLHSDDGKIYFNNQWENFTQPFGKNDCIGCGIFFNGSGYNIFYTKNGNFIGFAFCNIKLTELYPVVGIDSTNKIKFNFGMQKFEFNFLKINNLSCETYKLINNKKKIQFNKLINYRDPSDIVDRYKLLNIFLNKYINEIDKLRMNDYEIILRNIYLSINSNNTEFFLLSNSFPNLLTFLSGPKFLSTSLYNSESITADSDDEEMESYLQINFP